MALAQQTILHTFAIKFHPIENNLIINQNKPLYSCYLSISVINLVYTLYQTEIIDR